MRLGRVRGRPRPPRGTRTCARVGSAKVTSCGEADVTQTPKGRPLPSASTTAFVPLPRFVLPTARPPFLPERRSHPGTFLPSAAGRAGPKYSATPAKHAAKHLAPPTRVASASRSRGWEIRPAGRASEPLCAAPKESLRHKLGCLPGDAPHAVSHAPAARNSPSPPTADLSVAYKNSRPDGLAKASTSLETESHFETSSRLHKWFGAFEKQPSGAKAP